MVWRLYRDLDRMREEMNHLFSREGMFPWGPNRDRTGPPVNVHETPEEFLVQLEAPGARRDAFDVSFASGFLAIRGAYAEDEVEGTLLRGERPRREFARTVRLGEEIDPGRTEATYERGILTVRVAKSEKARPRRIEVKVD